MSTEATAAPAAAESAAPAATEAAAPIAETPAAAPEATKEAAAKLSFWKDEPKADAKPKEEPVEAAKEEPKPDPKVGELFTRLTRMEREHQKLRAENEELKKRPAPETVTVENFWDFARKNGINPQAAIDVLVKDPSKAKPPEDPEKLEMKRQVEELKKDAEARKAREAKEKWEATVSGVKNNMRERVKAAGEKYELVAAEGDDAIENAWAIIEAHGREHGEVPDIDDVLSRLESAYEAQLQRRLTTKKALAKLPKASPQQSASGRPPASGQRTLSNRATASASTRELPENPTNEDLARLIRWNS